MIRTFMITAASAAILTLSPTVFAQQSDHGTAEQAKAMLLKAEAAVKADKTKALNMFNAEKVGSWTATSMYFAPISVTVRSLRMATLMQSNSLAGRQDAQGLHRQAFGAGLSLPGKSRKVKSPR